MKKCLKIIDFYPQSFIFTYKGNKFLKTMIGGILSLLSFISILINAILIGKDIYLKEKPNVLEVIKKENFTPSMRIDSKSTKLGFSLTNEIDIIEYNSYIQVLPVYTTQILNKKNKYIYRKHLLELEDCKRTENDTIYYQKCIKDMDLYLTGSWAESSLAFLNIEFKKCQNDTYENFSFTNAETDEDEKLLDEFEKNINKLYQSKYISEENLIKNSELNLFEYLKTHEIKKDKNNSKCLPHENIDEFLKESMYVTFIYNKIQFDPVEHKNPLNSVEKVSYNILGNKVRKDFNLYYTNFVSQSDEGIIFEDIILDHNRLGINLVTSDILFKDDTDILANLSFYMSREIKICLRRYIKLQVIFANLGGSISLTILLSNLISLPYFDRMKNLKIINEFFELYDHDKSENSKKLLDIKLNDFQKSRVIERKEIKDNTNDLINIKINILEKKSKSEREIINFSPPIKQEREIKEEKEDIKFDNDKNKLIFDFLDKKKLFTKLEIFRSSYYFICGNKELNIKNSKYQMARKNIFNGTDFLEIIKLNRDFKVFKYLLLNNIQQKTLDYITNLKIDQIRCYDKREYTEITNTKDPIEIINIMKEYYSEEYKLDSIDMKLYEMIHPKIKDIFNGSEE